MNNTNRLLTQLLSVSLIASNLLFSSVSADENGCAEYINVSDEETGVVYQQPCDCGDKMQLEANLIPLAKPTGLQWHLDDHNSGKLLMGNMVWNPVNNCEGEYKITLYRNGTEIDSTNWSGLYDNEGDNLVGCDFINNDAFSADGAYVFEVIAKGDNVTFGNSEPATSPVYNFKAPSAKLSTPANVRWTADGVLSHSGVANASGYEYTIYDQDGKEVGNTWHVSSFVDTSAEIIEDVSDYLIDIAGWRDNFTGAYVSVKALTYNIELYQNSNDSAWTELYDIGSAGNTFENTIGGIIGDVNNGSMSATQALDTLLNEMFESDISNTDLAITMTEKQSVVDQIADLESEYCHETGINVSVSDTAKDSQYLENRGIDTDKISVVGAALNSYGKDVDINFSEADPNLSVDHLYYKNSVAVNIGIDGVNDSQKLDIPIQITMPVPTGVVPDRLVILHYHADGTIEEIHPALTYTNGEYFIKFVLTSFSPFVFCNLQDEDVPVQEYGSIKVVSAEATLGGNVDVEIEVDSNPGIAAIMFGVKYDSDAMTLMSVQTGDVFEESQFTPGNPDKNPYILLALNAVENVNAEGNLVTLSFSINSGCSYGDYGIEIVDFEACDIDENSVWFDIQNGFVEVIKPAVPYMNINPVISSDGETVYAYFTLENNPGIACLGFDVEYDSSAMTLTDARNGVVFPEKDIEDGNLNQNPYMFLAIDSKSDVTGDGVVLVLEFKLNDGASFGNINISDLEVYNINEAPVDLTLCYNDLEHCGDVNSDGKVNRKDLLRIAKYFAGFDVELSTYAADVDVDYDITRADLLRIAKHLSGWDDAVLGH